MTPGGLDHNNVAPLEWDKRPSALDTGESRPARFDGEKIVVVGSRPDGAGWRVTLLGAKEPPIDLTPAKARRLAAELVSMADILEFGWDE